MNKKLGFGVFILLVFLVILFFYEVISNTVNNAIDNKNRRGIELYVSAIKYAYAKEYLNNDGVVTSTIDELNIDIIINIKCEEKRFDSFGEPELKGCTVDNSKMKYTYINGLVERE